MGMIDSSILAVSRVPNNTWEWFLICIGGFILFILLIVMAGTLARSREDRREGRAPARERRERSVR